jgi:hypothetical protein
MKYKNHLTPEQEKFVWENRTQTARALAEVAKAKVWQVRYFLYSKGYRKMEAEYWTDEMVVFLKGSFREIGDKELAAIYQDRWPKNKPWTLKHIEKKRNYLGLHRTKEELKDIKTRNAKQGCWMTGKTWQTRGQAPLYHIAEWETTAGYFRKFIKLASGYVPLAPYVWEQVYGPTPKGHVIRHKDNDQMNCELDNLECIPYEENARRNSLKSSKGLSDNYVVAIQTMNEPHLREELKKRPELIELMRARLLLNREINNHKEQR